MLFRGRGRGQRPQGVLLCCAFRGDPPSPARPPSRSSAPRTCVRSGHQAKRTLAPGTESSSGRGWDRRGQCRPHLCPLRAVTGERASGDRPPLAGEAQKRGAVSLKSSLPPREHSRTGMQMGQFVRRGASCCCFSGSLFRSSRILWGLTASVIPGAELGARPSALLVPSTMEGS